MNIKANQNGAAVARPMATRRTAAAAGGDAKVNGNLAAGNRPKVVKPSFLNGNAAAAGPKPVGVPHARIGYGLAGAIAKPRQAAQAAKPAGRVDGVLHDDEDEVDHQMETDSGHDVTREIENVAGGSTVSTALTHPTFEQKALFGKVKTRFCERPHNVPDIYEEDGSNEQMMTAYVHYIFDYLHDIEASFTLPPKWLEGSDIQPRMRAILIDWMISLHLKFRMQVDTLYLAVDLLDRFLALDDVKVTKDELQLVGVTCLFTASKFEEIYPPDVADYVYMADGACTKSDVLAMEMVILHKLQFSLNAPLGCKFLRRYAKAAESDTREYGIAKYILEMTLLAPDMTCYKASFKASAAQLTAMLVLDNYKILQSSSAPIDADSDDEDTTPRPLLQQPALSADMLNSLWTPTMVFYSTYTVNDLLALVKKYLVMLESAHTNTKYTALRKKYSQDNFCKISTMDELQPLHIVALSSVVEAFIANNKQQETVVAENLHAPVAVPMAAAVAAREDTLDMSVVNEDDSKPTDQPAKPILDDLKNPLKTVDGAAATKIGLQVPTKNPLVVRQTNRAVAVKR